MAHIAGFVLFEPFHPDRFFIWLIFSVILFLRLLYALADEKQLQKNEKESGKSISRLRLELVAFGVPALLLLLLIALNCRWQLSWLAVVTGIGLILMFLSIIGHSIYFWVRKKRKISA